MAAPFRFIHCSTTTLAFPSFRIRATRPIVSLSSCLSASEFNSPRFRSCFVTSFVVGLPPFFKISRSASSIGRAVFGEPVALSGLAVCLAVFADRPTGDVPTTSSSDRDRFIPPSGCNGFITAGAVVTAAAAAAALCAAFCLSRCCNRNGCNSGPMKKKRCQFRKGNQGGGTW